jgi:hypothetical protein
MGTPSTDSDAERPRTQWPRRTSTRVSERASERAAYGTVMVVPSPVAVTENVPVLLEV